MNDLNDELDPARTATMKALVVEHARSDIRTAPARARRRRVATAVAGFGVVAAVTAGAVAIALAGVPLFGEQSVATTGPPVTRTSTPAPSPSPPGTPGPSATPAPSVPPESAPSPTVEEFQAAVNAAGFECASVEPFLPEREGVVSSVLCLPSQHNFTVFDDPARVTETLGLNAGSLESARLLHGAQWIVGVDDVDGESADLITLQSQLGGTLNFDPGASCAALVDPSVVAEMEGAGLIADELWPDDSANYGDFHQRFAEFGGASCRWGFPNSDNVRIFSYAPVTAAQAAGMQQTLADQGFTTESRTGGVVYISPVNPSDYYLFTDGAVYETNAAERFSDLVPYVLAGL